MRYASNRQQQTCWAKRRGITSNGKRQTRKSGIELNAKKKKKKRKYNHAGWLEARIYENVHVCEMCLRPFHQKIQYFVGFGEIAAQQVALLFLPSPPPFSKQPQTEKEPKWCVHAIFVHCADVYYIIIWSRSSILSHGWNNRALILPPPLPLPRQCQPMMHKPVCTHHDFYLLLFFSLWIFATQCANVNVRWSCFTLCSTNEQFLRNFCYAFRVRNRWFHRSEGRKKEKLITRTVRFSPFVSDIFLSSFPFPILNGSAIDIKLSVYVPMSVARTQSNPHTRTQSYLEPPTRIYLRMYVLSCVAITSMSMYSSTCTRNLMYTRNMPFVRIFHSSMAGVRVHKTVRSLLLLLPPLRLCSVLQNIRCSCRLPPSPPQYALFVRLPEIEERKETATKRKYKIHTKLEKNCRTHTPRTLARNAKSIYNIYK